MDAMNHVQIENQQRKMVHLRPFGGCGLDRVLSGTQLARGFGALTLGGALGMLCSLAACCAVCSAA
jgi:hypothetical protein